MAPALLTAALAACVILYRQLRREVARAEELLGADRAVHLAERRRLDERVAQLERQIDHLHSQGLRTEPVVALPDEEEARSLPPALEAALAGFDSPDDAEDFREHAQWYLRTHPSAGEAEVMAAVLGDGAPLPGALTGG